MTCPDPSRLLLLQLGELSINEASELSLHSAGCVQCSKQRRAQQQLLLDLQTPPVLAESAESFTARTLAACEAVASEPVRSRPAWFAAGVAGVIAVAAAFAIVRWQDASAEISARGGSEPASQAFAELLFVRERIFYPASGAQLRAGDGLAVRCTNNGSRPVQLMVFGLDSANTVHWIYPRYLDADDNPSSIVLGSGVRDQLLDEVVEPEQPALGPLRVIALLGQRTLHVQEVEAQLAQLGKGSAAQLWPDMQTQEWSATWTGK